MPGAGGPRHTKGFGTVDPHKGVFRAEIWIRQHTSTCKPLSGAGRFKYRIRDEPG